MNRYSLDNYQQAYQIVYTFQVYILIELIRQIDYKDAIMMTLCWRDLIDRLGLDACASEQHAA